MNNIVLKTNLFLLDKFLVFIYIFFSWLLRFASVLLKNPKTIEYFISRRTYVYTCKSCGSVPIKYK